jgi:DNA-binding MarR family transcriptional regulator
MNSSPPPTNDRSSQIEHVSTDLVRRASLMLRLLARQLSSELSRTEAGLLSTLSRGPRRITALAELEGLAQPTMTLLVKRLEEHGLAMRRRQTDDGRVVLVSLTEAGAAALADYRARASGVLRTYLAAMSDSQVETLAAATEALDVLIGLLQHAPIERAA